MSTSLPSPTPRTTSLTPLFRWLRTPWGRTVVHTLVCVIALQGLPFGLLLPSAHSATPVFGPEDFLRSKGKPLTVERTFFIDDPSGIFTLCIDNGGQHDDYGFVTSAEVHLNGLEVASPSDFNQNVAEVVRPVLVAIDNTLSVQLRGAPGSGFTLQIVPGTSCEVGANTAPVADAGLDHTVFVGDTVQLDGSHSSDADDDSLTFQWSFVSLPAGSGAVLSDPTAAMPSFVVDVAGEYGGFCPTPRKGIFERHPARICWTGA